MVCYGPLPEIHFCENFESKYYHKLVCYRQFSYIQVLWQHFSTILWQTCNLDKSIHWLYMVLCTFAVYRIPFICSISILYISSILYIFLLSFSVHLLYIYTVHAVYHIRYICCISNTVHLLYIIYCSFCSILVFGTYSFYRILLLYIIYWIFAAYRILYICCTIWSHTNLINTWLINA